MGLLKEINSIASAPAKSGNVILKGYHLKSLWDMFTRTPEVYKNKSALIIEQIVLQISNDLHTLYIEPSEEQKEDITYFSYVLSNAWDCIQARDCVHKEGVKVNKDFVEAIFRLFFYFDTE